MTLLVLVFKQKLALVPKFVAVGDFMTSLLRLQAHQTMQLKIREVLKMKYTLLCLIFLEK